MSSEQNEILENIRKRLERSANSGEAVPMEQVFSEIEKRHSKTQSLRDAMLTKNVNAVAAYLNYGLEEQNLGWFLVVLDDVIKSLHGGIDVFSQKLGCKPEKLSDALFHPKNMDFYFLIKILKQIGLNITLKVKVEGK